MMDSTSSSEFPVRLGHFLLTHSKLDLRFVMSMRSLNYCCLLFRSWSHSFFVHTLLKIILHNKKALYFLYWHEVIWPYVSVGVQHRPGNRSQTCCCSSPDLLPAPLHPKHVQLNLCLLALECVQWVQRLCPSSGPRHKHSLTDCLNFKGQNEDKTFFWPVAVSSRIESQSLDKLSQKQDGAVMIGLVASVQFSPLTDDQRFKHKGLRYSTKLFNNVFLASHWASPKW